MRKTMLVLACFALVACGTEMMSHVMDDAGHALVDAADVLDGGDDAAAQDMPRVVEVACDGVGTITTTTGAAIAQTTTYYGLLTDLAISTDAPNITAAICNRTVVTNDPDAMNCPSGSHCTDTRPTYLACTTVPVDFDNGHARVVCGTSVHTDPDGSGPSVAQESGYKYTSVRFTIR